VIRELGRGGMGVVYLAKDPFIDRLVAIKTAVNTPLYNSLAPEQFQKLFFREAQASGKLIHPNIVSVYDVSVENDKYYLIMEYVDGSTLKEYCGEKGLLPVDKAVEIIFQCAKGLYYAHQNKVIHRDIKPGNVLISKNGHAKISDFGIAMVKGFSDLPWNNSITGSVSYTPPEQLENRPFTPRSDLFSLGVVMYEILTGTRPFEADNDFATLFKIQNEAAESLKRYRHEIPEPLEKIVMRALEKDPSKRYQNCLQLASDLSTSFDHLRFLDQEINFEEKFNAIKRIKFFNEFSSGELAEVIKSTQWLKYEATSTIIIEGEIEDCFYIIVTGQVRVIKQGKVLTVLNQGECFGEMAYLGKTTRTATIEALSDTILMKLNSSVIDQTSIPTQHRFYREFSKILIERLIRTSELLTKSSF
jgi:serine/threonine protein kinase